jgi:hypothetical protein
MSFRSDAWGEDFTIEYGQETDSKENEVAFKKSKDQHFIFVTTHDVKKLIPVKINQMRE